MQSLWVIRPYKWWLVPMAVLIALVVAVTARAAPEAHAEWHPSHAALTAPAPDTVLRLQGLLAHHSVLASDMMRGRISSQDDLLAAVNAALGKNTDAISQLVGSLYGDQAARQFTGVWTRHLEALLRYAKGLADQNDQTRAEARAALEEFERDIGFFF